LCPPLADDLLATPPGPAARVFLQRDVQLVVEVRRAAPSAGMDRPSNAARLSPRAAEQAEASVSVDRA
jgi:hypothetical protein